MQFTKRTSAGKLAHGKHVERLEQKLRDYNIDPLGKGSARHFTTVKYQVVKDPLKAPVLGNERYTQFVEDCLVSGIVGLLDPIKKPKLSTGLSKKVKQQEKFRF